jgi:hypothetical protein
VTRDTIDPAAQRQLDRERTAEQAKTAARAAHPAGMDRTPIQMANDLLDRIPDDRERSPKASEWADAEVACERLLVKLTHHRRAAALDDYEADR